VRERREIEVVKFLVSKGADVNAKNKDDNTPLHLAASWNGHIEVIEFLVSKGADISVTNVAGYSPLMAAIRYNGNAEIAGFFIFKGTNVRDCPCPPSDREANSDATASEIGENSREIPDEADANRK